MDTLKTITQWAQSKQDLSWEQGCQLWKALWFGLYLADKPAPQANVINASVSIVRALPTPAARQAFHAAFWATVFREWHGLDRHRVDKFFQLQVRMIEVMLECAVEADSADILVGPFTSQRAKGPFARPSLESVGVPVARMVTSSFVTEKLLELLSLDEVNASSDEEEDDDEEEKEQGATQRKRKRASPSIGAVPQHIIEAVLASVLQFAASQSDRRLREMVRASIIEPYAVDTVFDHEANQLPEGLLPLREEVRSFLAGECARLASSLETRDTNRSTLHSWKKSLGYVAPDILSPQAALTKVPAAKKTAAPATPSSTADGQSSQRSKKRKLVSVLKKTKKVTAASPTTDDADNADEIASDAVAAAAAAAIEAGMDPYDLHEMGSDAGDTLDSLMEHANDTISTARGGGKAVKGARKRRLAAQQAEMAMAVMRVLARRKKKEEANRALQEKLRARRKAKRTQKRGSSSSVAAAAVAVAASTRRRRVSFGEPMAKGYHVRDPPADVSGAPVQHPDSIPRRSKGRRIPM